MDVRRIATVLVSAALVVGGAGIPATAAVKHYKNCATLNKTYKHGVGKKGARDHTTGKPVTTFTVSNTVYAANKKLDRDKDSIACEKR